MKTIGQVLVAGAVLLAVFAGGCGDSDSCAAESPVVQDIADCTARAGAVVPYQVQLCPTCNQNLTGCTVDMSAAPPAGGTIFLNPVVEACQTSAEAGCGAATCLANPTCSVTVPATSPNGAVFTVEVFDPGTNATRTGTLTVADQAPSCTFI
jgi:hypothetical protein